MQQRALMDNLRRIVGERSVFHEPADLLVYEYDGSVDGAVETAPPLAVVLPTSSGQVAEIVKVAREAGLPVIARGAGTGLSGGAVAQTGGIIVALTRMDQILDVDLAAGTALVVLRVRNERKKRAAASSDPLDLLRRTVKAAAGEARKIARRD